MSRRIIVAAASALVLLFACDHGNPVQPPPPSGPLPKGNQPPVAHITGPTTAIEGISFQLSAAGSSDPEGGHLTFSWNFGNGQSIDVSSPGPEWDAYTDEGLYTVTLIVRDDSGASDTATAAITVANAAPRIDAIAAPRQQAIGITAGTVIKLSDTGLHDTLAVTVHWGDGQSDSLHGVDPYNAEVSLFHSYTTPGLFHVGATVRDNDGGVSSLTSDTAVIVFDPSEQKSIAGYDVLDLGTLGGNDARPQDINDRGQVVGRSSGHGFLWDGTLHDLGTLGYQNSNAAAIDESGVIAGELWNVTDDYYPTQSIAAKWQGGAWQILDSPQPRPPVLVRDIRDANTVLVSEFHWEGAVGWLWRDGGWHRFADFLPSASGHDSYVMDMNARGQVVGAALYRMDDSHEVLHAALWAGDSAHDLGVLAPLPCPYAGDCSRAKATGINDDGQIVGFSTDAAGNLHFVAWLDGEIRDLGPARGMLTTSAQAFINASGQIAGVADGEGFFWNSAGSTRATITAPGGRIDIVGLNANGEVAGDFVTATGEQHVFIWSQSRGMVDLGSGPHAFGCAWATGMNARGDIIGYAEPCPIPDPVFGLRNEARPILWRRK